MTKTQRWTVLGAAAVVGAFAVSRALVVTDRDRVERFAEAVSGEVTPARIDAALRYVDVERQPVEVTAYEATETYGPGQREALRQRVRVGLRAVTGARFRGRGSGGCGGA